jgi:hypothetical protein
LRTACRFLERLPGLRSLSLQVITLLAGHQEKPQDTLQLADTLSTHTQLQHLEMRADLHGYLPCLAGLPALPSLGLSFLPHGELQRGDLQVVSALSGLRKLSLQAASIQRGQRGQCMRMVRSLPLLEAVQLQCCKWTEGEAAVLLPPSEALQRVVLGEPASAAAACAALDAVDRLRNYAVIVVAREVADV